MKLYRKTENLNQFSIEMCLCVLSGAHTLPTIVMWCDGEYSFFMFSIFIRKTQPHTVLPIFIPCRYLLLLWLYGVFLFSARVIFAKAPQKKNHRGKRTWKGTVRERERERKNLRAIFYFSEIVPVLYNVFGWWWMRNDSRFPSCFGFGYLFASMLLSPSSSTSSSSFSSSVFMCTTKISRKIFDLVEYYTHATARSLAGWLACFVRFYLPACCHDVCACAQKRCTHCF